MEASYFNDVLLYHDGVRKDNQAFLDTKLTQGQVASLCDETGADAVISIDRLLFDMKKSVGTLGEGYVMGMIDVQMARWYFTGMGSRWKEASAYAANEKWDMAEDRWSGLYRGTENWKSRAKAASNLALCHEMRGALKEAYEWAHKSYDLFKRNNGDNDKSTKLLELYVQALAERIRSDKKLNVQFGED